MKETSKARPILLVSRDRGLISDIRAAFAASDQVVLETFEGAVGDLRGEVQQAGCHALIVELDTSRLDEMEALQRLMRRLEGDLPVLVVADEIAPAAARILIQLHVADLLVKPIGTSDLVRACLRALSGPSRGDGAESVVRTFMPAAGGVGNTTLVLTTAFQLHNAAGQGASTCVVDLNLQQGSCAEYLDLEPRFDITEVENQPERLDRQLLDVMLSRHESGLCVLAAPARPADMRSFDTDVVVRMLDLVSAYFDNVVLDLPRTWFPWTRTVLLGSNKLYIVSEMTVPCLRQAQRLMSAISDMVGNEVSPHVIINRIEKRANGGGVRPEDVQELLGERYAGGIANNYKLVREAVDRGLPLHEIDAGANVIADLCRIILPDDPKAKVSRGGLFSLAGGLFRRAG